MRGCASTRGRGWRRTGWSVKIEVKGLVLVNYGEGFRFQIKTARIKFLVSRFSQGNPFAELCIDVINAETRHSVQVKITAELDVFRIIFLPLRSLRNVAWAKNRIWGKFCRSLSSSRSRKRSRSRPNATLPKHQSDERAKKTSMHTANLPKRSRRSKRQASMN
jgi:hypothetical protein